MSRNGISSANYIKSRLVQNADYHGGGVGGPEAAAVEDVTPEVEGDGGGVVELLGIEDGAWGDSRTRRYIVYNISLCNFGRLPFGDYGCSTALPGWILTGLWRFASGAAVGEDGSTN